MNVSQVFKTMMVSKNTWNLNKKVEWTMNILNIFLTKTKRFHKTLSVKTFKTKQSFRLSASFYSEK